MATAVLADRTYTADEFLRMPGSKAFELLDGCLVERNVGRASSKVAHQLHVALGNFIGERGLGDVYDASIGLRIFPDRPSRIPRPDLAFVTAARLTPGLPDGFLTVAPDLVVEVVSPGDTATALDAKIEEYFSAGVRLVWVAYPETHRIYVFTPGREAVRLGQDDVLDGGDVLPGLEVKLRDIFGPLSEPAAAAPGAGEPA